MQQKPLYSNPIINSSMNPGQQTQKSFADLAKNKNPYNSEFIGLGKDQTNLFGYKVPDEIIKAQEEMMKKNPINMFNATLPAELGEQLDMGKYEGNPNFNGSGGTMIPETSADLKGISGKLPELLGAFNPAEQYEGGDPLVKGYLGSDFYESMTTANVVPYTYQGKEMEGSGSYASNFKKYLESIGKGDLLQFPDQGIMTQELAKVAGPEDSLTGSSGTMPFQPPGSSITDMQDKTLPGFQFPDGQGPLQNNKLGIENLQNSYQNNNNMSNFKNMEKLLQNIDGGIQSLIDNSSYMQSNNNLSQFPFSNSSSPNFMGGDILKWSSYK